MYLDVSILIVYTIYFGIASIDFLCLHLLNVTSLAGICIFFALKTDMGCSVFYHNNVINYVNDTS